MLKYSKYSKIALPLALVSTLALADNEKKDWRQKLQEGMGKAKETTQEYKEKATDSYQRYKQETSEKFRADQQQFRQSDLGRLVEQNARDVASNPSKVYEIKRNMQHYALNSTASAVKKLPVYDPTDGKVKTYDQFIRESLGSMNIDLPQALEEDPTKAMIFMSLDSDYLLNAKLIKSGNNWLSLREEMTSINPNETAKEAYASYIRMKDAFKSSNRDLANNYMQGFVTNISKLNQQSGLNFNAQGHGLIGTLKDSFPYHRIDNLTSMALKGGALENKDRAPLNLTIMGLLSLLGLYTAVKIAKSGTRSNERKTRETPANKLSAGKEKLVLDPKTNQFVKTSSKNNLEDVVEEDKESC